MTRQPTNYYGTPARSIKNQEEAATTFRRPKGEPGSKQNEVPYHLRQPADPNKKACVKRLTWAPEKKDPAMKKHYPDMNSKGKSADMVLHHQAQAGECVRNLYTHDQLTDVTIIIERCKFSAHKAVLMTYSGYFKKVLATTDPQARTEIEICGIPSPAFESILQYMYTAEIFLKMDNIGDIHTAAKQLIMVKLLDECEKVIESISPHDALVILHTSYKKDGEICQRAFHILINAFMEVVDTPGLAAMDMDAFMMIISSDILAVDSEMDVFRAAMNWLRNDFGERRYYVNDIMLEIRFPYMSPLELLFSTEMMENLDTDLEADLLESMWYSVANMYRRESRPPKALKSPRLYLLLPDYSTLIVPTPKHRKKVKILADHLDKAILIVGGVPSDPHSNMDDSGRAIYSYLPEDQTWKKVGQLPEARHLHAVVVLGEHLYVIGGARPTDQFKNEPFPTSTVTKWTLKTRKWSECQDMINRRIHHSAATVHNKIYVLSGQTDRNRLLASMEMYRPLLDRWEEVSSLSVGRIGMAVAVHNCKIIVAGGYEGVCTNSSGKYVMSKVEIYDPTNDSWSSMGNLPAPRCHACLVVASGDLYMCGGAKRSCDHDKKLVVVSLSSVDKYYPDHDTWERYSCLKYHRHGARAVAIGNRVYLIGGVSSIAEGPINKVECLDIKSGVGCSSDLACPAQMGMAVVVCDAKLMEGTYITPDRRLAEKECHSYI